MNKKTLLLAGLALGCSMAVAGVGFAVSAFNASPVVETKAETSSSSVTAEGGTFDGWTSKGVGSYADGTAKFDGSGDNVYKTDIFSGIVSTGMTSLSVTVNGKINGSPAATNSYRVEALDSSGKSLGNDTKTGASIYGSNFGDVTFTISSGLTNCTGIRVTYVTKGGGNWSVNSISWTATYSATDPIVSWDGDNHPSAGYTNVPLTYAATVQNISNPDWTWTVSPNAGVTIDDADELAEITFANAGSYTVTAYAEDSTDSSKHAQVTQEVEIAQSTSTLSLSETEVNLGLSEYVDIIPTVTNTGSYTDTNVTVTATSGSDLITLSGLTDGKVVSGSAVRITAKTNEGSAVVTFSNNGNTETCAIEISDIKTIVYTFTDKDWKYNTTGSASVPAYTTTPSWASSVAANSFETSSPARGVQIGAAKGEVSVTLTATSEMKAYSVTKVDIIASSNGTGNTIGLTVGDATFKSGDDATVSTNSATNKEFSFAGNGCGDVVLGISDGNKSVYIKSVTLTIVQNTSVVTKFVNDFMKMDQYVSDETYEAARCTSNYAPAKAAYEKLNSAQKKLFATGSDYTDAAERFGAWATANGDTFDTSTGALTAAVVNPFGFKAGTDSSLPIVITIIAVGGVAAAGLFFVQHKRRKEF